MTPASSPHVISCGAERPRPHGCAPPPAFAWQNRQGCTTAFPPGHLVSLDRPWLPEPAWAQPRGCGYMPGPAASSQAQPSSQTPSPSPPFVRPPPRSPPAGTSRGLQGHLLTSCVPSVFLSPGALSEPRRGSRTLGLHIVLAGVMGAGQGSGAAGVRIIITDVVGSNSFQELFSTQAQGRVPAARTLLSVNPQSSPTCRVHDLVRST